MGKKFNNKNERKSGLPENWFMNDQEESDKMSDYKGWIHQKSGKPSGEIPCLTFPI